VRREIYWNKKRKVEVYMSVESYLEAIVRRQNATEPLSKEEVVFVINGRFHGVDDRGNDYATYVTDISYGEAVNIAARLGAGQIRKLCLNELTGQLFDEIIYFFNARNKEVGMYCSISKLLTVCTREYSETIFNAHKLVDTALMLETLSRIWEEHSNEPPVSYPPLNGFVPGSFTHQDEPRIKDLAMEKYRLPVQFALGTPEFAMYQQTGRWQDKEPAVQVTTPEIEKVLGMLSKPIETLQVELDSGPLELRVMEASAESAATADETGNYSTSGSKVDPDPELIIVVHLPVESSIDSFAIRLGKHCVPSRLWQHLLEAKDSNQSVKMNYLFSDGPVLCVTIAKGDVRALVYLDRGDILGSEALTVELIQLYLRKSVCYVVD
jgi:hypothetical protein